MKMKLVFFVVLNIFVLIGAELIIAVPNSRAANQQKFPSKYIPNRKIPLLKISASGERARAYRTGEAYLGIHQSQNLVEPSKDANANGTTEITLTIKVNPDHLLELIKSHGFQQGVTSIKKKQSVVIKLVPHIQVYPVAAPTLQQQDTNKTESQVDYSHFEPIGEYSNVVNSSVNLPDRNHMVRGSKLKIHMQAPQPIRKLNPRWPVIPYPTQFQTPMTMPAGAKYTNKENDHDAESSIVIPISVPTNLNSSLIIDTRNKSNFFLHDGHGDRGKYYSQVVPDSFSVHNIPNNLDIIFSDIGRFYRRHWSEAIKKLSFRFPIPNTRSTPLPPPQHKTSAVFNRPRILSNEKGNISQHVNN